MGNYPIERAHIDQIWHVYLQLKQNFEIIFCDNWFRYEIRKYLTITEDVLLSRNYILVTVSYVQNDEILRMFALHIIDS